MHLNRYNTIWIVCLGILFFTTYGAVNNIGAYFDSINPVPSIVFNWEYRIPFVSWFIYPYMSVDLFYALSFFIIAKDTFSNEQYKKIIKGLGNQLLFNQFFSLLCFLSFPLKFSFPKPLISENKQLFDLLLSFDLPYNQAPSLHISILIILTVFYNQHLKNTITKLILNIWFVLISLSVIFTYQHHFIDLALGAYLGLAVVYMFNCSPKHKQSIPTNEHLKKQSYYKYFRNGLIITSFYLFLLPILNNFGIINFKIEHNIYIFSLIIFISFMTIFKLMFFGNSFNVRNNKNHFNFIFLLVGIPFIFIRRLFLYPFNYYEQTINIYENIHVGNLLVIEKEANHIDRVFINLTWECDNLKQNSISLPLVDLSIPTKEQLIHISNIIKEHSDNNKEIFLHCALGLFRTFLALGSYYILHKGYTSNDFFELIKNSDLNPKIKNHLNKNRNKFENIFNILN